MTACRTRGADHGNAVLGMAEFRTIADLVHRETGIHLPDIKRTMVEGRLARRLRLLGLPDFAAYLDLVGGRGGAEERSRMIAALTTNVTRFNREPHHFDALREGILPALAPAVRRGGRLRIWSAACSSGEEPCSIALAILAVMPDAPRLDVRVLATDINAEMVARGRAGVFPSAALADVAPAERTRLFEPAEGGWRAGPEIAGLLSFRVLNLIGDWPMRGRFDAIFCRNVAIYFDAPTQMRLWERLAALVPAGGHLFIGHSERLAGPAERMFRPVGTTMYQRLGEARP